jgi:hypothetical protein
MIRLLAIAAAVATGVLIGACHGSTSAMDHSDAAAQEASRGAPSRSASVRIKPMSFRLLSELAGVQCTDPENGKDCISGNADSGDFQTVELRPRCDETGTFGRVTRDAEVMNRTPPNDTTELAKVGQGANVCVQAIAREGQTDGYYYVTPAECLTVDNTSGKECVSGWVDAADVSIPSQ